MGIVTICADGMTVVSAPVHRELRADMPLPIIRWPALSRSEFKARL